jgi:hypothetical protein
MAWGNYRAKGGVSAARIVRVHSNPAELASNTVQVEGENENEPMEFAPTIPGMMDHAEVGGYAVVHPDGHRSFMSEAAFEDQYESGGEGAGVDPATFGHAPGNNLTIAAAQRAEMEKTQADMDSAARVIHDRQVHDATTSQEEAEAEHQAAKEDAEEAHDPVGPSTHHPLLVDETRHDGESDEVYAKRIQDMKDEAELKRMEEEEAAAKRV